MEWSLFATLPLICFMKLYTNLIQTKTMSVIISLHKTCLGQSWQAKSIFWVLVGDDTHVFAGWLGIWLICGIMLLNIILSGTQHIGAINTSRVCCCLGQFQHIPKYWQEGIKSCIKNPTANATEVGFTDVISPLEQINLCSVLTAVWNPERKHWQDIQLYSKNTRTSSHKLSGSIKCTHV